MPPNREIDFLCNVWGDFLKLITPFFPCSFEINMSRIETRKDMGKISVITSNLPLNLLVLA